MLVTTLEADPYPRPHPDGPHRIRRHHRQPQDQGAVARRRSHRNDAASPSCWPSAAWRACRWSAPKPATSSPSPASKTPPSPTRCATSTVDDADSRRTRSIRRPSRSPSRSTISPCRPRRRQGAEPRHPRAPAARSRRQCRHQGCAKPATATYEVAGRGELQLGVLIETMRREGFELSISRPRVLFKTDEDGERLEPIEEVTIDVDDAYTGIVIEKIIDAQRRDDATCAPPAPARPASSSTRRRAG